MTTTQNTEFYASSYPLDSDAESEASLYSEDEYSNYNPDELDEYYSQLDAEVYMEPVHDEPVFATVDISPPPSPHEMDIEYQRYLSTMKAFTSAVVAGLQSSLAEELVSNLEFIYTRKRDQYYAPIEQKAMEEKAEEQQRRWLEESVAARKIERQMRKLARAAFHAKGKARALARSGPNSNASRKAVDKMAKIEADRKAKSDARRKRRAEKQKAWIAANAKAKCEPIVEAESIVEDAEVEPLDLSKFFKPIDFEYCNAPIDRPSSGWKKVPVRKTHKERVAETIQQLFVAPPVVQEEPVSLVRTRMCNTVSRKIRCRRPDCNFAHTIAELSPRKCRFDSRCVLVVRKGDVFTNGKRPCTFIHTGETKNAYCTRLGIKAPQGTITPPKPAAKVRAPKYIAPTIIPDDQPSRSTSPWQKIPRVVPLDIRLLYAQTARYVQERRRRAHN